MAKNIHDQAAAAANPFEAGMAWMSALGQGMGPGALPEGLAQWLAPALSPEEAQKRIDQLSQIKFWVDQNAAGLEAAIKTLEVQRMTLATMRAMNIDPDAMARAMGQSAAKAGSSGEAADGSRSASLPWDPMAMWTAMAQSFLAVKNPVSGSDSE